jgi:hypothetical protein
LQQNLQKENEAQPFTKKLRSCNFFPREHLGHSREGFNGIEKNEIFSRAANAPHNVLLILIQLQTISYVRTRRALISLFLSCSVADPDP